MLKRADIEDLKRTFASAEGPLQDDPRGEVPLAQGLEEFDLPADAERVDEPDAGAMAKTSDEKPKGQADVVPLDTFDASQWEGVPIEPRRWIAHNRIPVGEPGIMSGDGGTGKTKLALQLAASVSAGLQDWIGGVVEAEGPVIVLSAEEKLKEMHRRSLDVLEHRQLSFKDLRGRLHFICDQEEPVLGAPDRNGIVQPTMSLLRLERTVAIIRPALVIIENAADVYSGSEIDRSNVTRFMRSLLGRLTVACQSTVMLIQHPSVSGLNDGTGRSGSTGWNNAGRWRNNFTKMKGEEDGGVRQYEVVKNNYGPDGERLRLRWERGVFVPESSVAGPAAAATFNAADRAYLDCLERLTVQGREVREHPGRGYAPKVFADMPEANGMTTRAFKAAQERLFSAGLIHNLTEGPASKRTKRIARKPADTSSGAGQ